MKASEIKEIIRTVVREELEKQLPGLLAKTLAESFLKQIVAETFNSGVKAAESSRPLIVRRPSLAETLMPGEEENEEGVRSDDVEETPEPLRNGNKGIYQKSPLVHQNEIVQRLVNPKESSGMAAFYEGTKPISENVEIPDLISEEKLKEFDPDVMKRLAGIVDPVDRGPIPSTPEMKMRELEQKRKALEVRPR